MDVVSKKDIFKVKLCSSFMSKVNGFMFRRFPGYDGLLFDLKGTKNYSLHMLFVFIPLDIVYLDASCKVLKILKKAQPFRFYIPAVKCDYILELKDCKHLKKNDRVVFMK